VAYTPRSSSKSARDPDFEVTLISQDNFFLFTPNGTRIKSFTLVWTAGAAPHPLTTGWIG